MNNDKEQSALEGWFILELFGHQCIAGFVKTVSLGGDAMLRLDVPEIKYGRRVYRDGGKSEIEQATIGAFTKFYSPKAVYAMTPVTAETAQAAMQSFRAEPINAFDLRQAALPAPVVTDEVEYDDAFDPDATESPS